MTSSLSGICNMIYSNEFFVVNKLLKKCWQHAYNHISPFYILECFMLWFGWQTICSNHYVTQDLRASVLIIACLSPFLGLGYLPYIHYSYPLAFTDSLVSTMRSHAVLCFFQWETWHSLKNEKENYFKYKTWYWRQKSETCTLWWKHLKSIVLIVEILKVLHVLTEHILHQSLHKLIVIITIYHLLLHHLSKYCYHSFDMV